MWLSRFLLTLASISVVAVPASFGEEIKVARPSAVQGIWSSAAELSRKPMQGPAWQAVIEAADRYTGRPEIADQNDKTNVRVLAAAIVHARTGLPVYRQKVVQSIERLVAAGKPSGRTLAWARNVGAFALAADLVGYRTDAFDTWLRNIAETWEGDDDRTLRLMFETRPNNWGSHAFGSLCAIYCYLGDAAALQAVRSHFVQGITGPNPGYEYGKDLSWQADASDPRIINPLGAARHGLSIDGIIPDDMRRGGPFQIPPRPTNYVWGAQQGMVMGARILERAGMPIWEVGDRALYRAAYALQIRLGGPWRAEGDDLWMLAFYDHAYGTNWSHGQDVWGAGKNTGWAYVLTPRQ